MSNDLLRTVKGSLANGLSDIIIDEYEKFFVVSLIDGNYGYLATKDREILKKKILRKLDNGANNGSSDNPRTYPVSYTHLLTWCWL